MNLHIGSDRLKIKRGNGGDRPGLDYETPTLEQPLMKFFESRTWRFMWKAVGIVALVIAGYYATLNRISAQERITEQLQQDVQRIAATAKTKESAEDDMRVLATQYGEILRRIDSIDKRIERIESRRSR